MTTTSVRKHARTGVAPAAFHAQATGVGNTRLVSLVTGNMRAQRIASTQVPQRPEVPHTTPHPAIPGTAPGEATNAPGPATPMRGARFGRAY